MGILVGWRFPGIAPTGKLLSEVFIDMIKMVIAPIIFFTIVLGIAGAGNLKQVGRVGGKALLYFEVVTTLALLIGLVVANLVKPGHGVSLNIAGSTVSTQYFSQAEAMDWVGFFRHIVPSNVVEAFAKGDILQVLFFSILFGLALSRMGSTGQPVLQQFERYNKVMFGIMKMVMQVAPIGAFGGMAFTIGKYGFATLGALGKLMASFYITVFLFVVVVLGLICKYYGFSLFKLLGYIKEEILITLGASSSEPVLPNLMQKLETAGCHRSVVGLVVPTGYSFNLDGTTIYLSMATLFMAQVYDINLSIAQQLTIIGILMVTSKGAAGVTGSGFIVLASTLSALKVIPLEGLALLVGIDRFMSEARSVTNFIGNAVATVVIAKSEKAVNMVQYMQVVEGKQPASTAMN
ncbi:MAG TPA: C4-dicarboxylate transporter DctA [Phnomibacter sp.]|nr:C4-dicarboxylate transporter DctA [Phnomibacter sp.]